MEPTMMIALASAFGALAFFCAGLVARPARAQPVPVVELEAGVPASVPRQFDEPPSAQPPVEPIDTAGEPPLSVRQALARLVSHHASVESAAVYDDEGLLVETWSGPPNERIGALVGVATRWVAQAEKLGLSYDTSVIELRDELDRVVRCRRIRRNRAGLWLVTVARRSAKPYLGEDAVIDALPRLLPEQITIDSSSELVLSA